MGTTDRGKRKDQSTLQFMWFDFHKECAKMRSGVDHIPHPFTAFTQHTVHSSSSLTLSALTHLT